MTQQQSEKTTADASAKKSPGASAGAKKRVLRPVNVEREAYSVQEFIHAMGWSEGLFHKVKNANQIATYKVGNKRFVTRAEKERIQREGVQLPPAKATGEAGFSEELNFRAGGSKSQEHVQ